VVSKLLVLLSGPVNLYIESTTIALLARISGLLDALRVFAKQKPVWGTCAGAIFLSQNVENAKKGGQELLHAMSVTIARNGWGSQVLLAYLLSSVNQSTQWPSWNHLKHP
jgi:glutamine amidotransferase PdxT